MLACPRVWKLLLVGDIDFNALSVLFAVMILITQRGTERGRAEREREDIL